MEDAMKTNEIQEIFRVIDLQWEAIQSLAKMVELNSQILKAQAEDLLILAKKVRGNDCTPENPCDACKDADLKDTLWGMGRIWQK